jgi:mono/diheme cytochrome c family protein
MITATGSHALLAKRLRRAFALSACLAACLIVTDGPVRLAAQGPRGLQAGRDLFHTHCASCHGLTGVGNGPAAGSMRKPPPDITGLSLANGGTFPFDRARRIVEGREVEAHGDREMPVWGDVFRAMDGGASKEVVRERIGAILEYLRAMQRRHS